MAIQRKVFAALREHLQKKTSYGSYRNAAYRKNNFGQAIDGSCNNDSKIIF